MTKIFFPFLIILFLTLSLTCESPKDKFPDWVTRFQSEISMLVKNHEGEFGIYLKDLSTNQIYSHNAHSPWYLASTVKLFIATRVLQLVQKGDLKLTDEIILKRPDYVDGAGKVNWQKPGSILSIEYLLNQMMTESDNTASDLLIEKVGLKSINNLANSFSQNNINITKLIDVRRLIFSELHEDGQKLTNFDYFKLKKIKNFDLKLQKFIELTGKKKDELKVKSIKDAYESYYNLNLNTSSLITIGNFIEDLLKRKILNEEMTKKLFTIMKNCKTGKTRLKNGLGPKISFIHKTGTQYNRMCDMGFVRVKTETDTKNIIIAVCAKNYGKVASGNSLFTEIGKAILKAGIVKIPKLQLAK